MKNNLIKSYAKINITLNVLGRNKNRFHKIKSIFSFIKLYDRIFIKKVNTKKHIVKFFGPFSKNLKNNSILQLLSILDKNKFLKNKYKITVTKNIPQKSGLGGGSMNAASILRYFLKKKIINLSKKELTNICNEIGSDVLLGLDQKNSILIKNNIKKYNKKIGLFVVLIKPNFGCSTKKIYSKVTNFSNNNTKVSNNVFKIENLKTESNDLEKPAFKLYPNLIKIKSFLESLEGVEFARMTGSGSSIVAYFLNKKSAINALKMVKKKYKNYWSILSKTI